MNRAELCALAEAYLDALEAKDPGRLSWADGAVFTENNVRLEPVKVPHWIRGRESLEIVAPHPGHVAMLGLGNSIGTPPEGLEAEVMVVKDREELEAFGVPKEEWNSRSACRDPNGVGPRLFFQRVPEGKTAKNRVHLDVRTASDLRGEERMTALQREIFGDTAHFDGERQKTVAEGEVTARRESQMQVCHSSRLRTTWIDYDELSPLLALLLHPLHDGRHRLGAVRTPKHQGLRFADVADWKGQSSI